MPHHSERGFVDPKVRRRINRVLLPMVILVGIVAIGLSISPKQDPNQYAVESKTGQEETVQVTAAPQQPLAQPEPPQQKEPFETPKQPEPSDSDWVNPFEKPKVDPQPNPIPPREAPKPKPVVPPSPALTTKSTKFQIIAGETAPHYRLRSFDDYLDMAKRRKCRFLVTDGNLTIEVGNRLTDSPRMATVDSDWHEIYATRVAPVPLNSKALRTLRAVGNAYSGLNVQRAKIFLSLPHELDQQIYDAQVRWFESKRTSMNVDQVTVIDFSGSGAFSSCRVIAAEKLPR